MKFSWELNVQNVGNQFVKCNKTPSPVSTFIGYTIKILHFLSDFDHLQLITSVN